MMDGAINMRRTELYLKFESVPRSKHTASVIKSSCLMLFMEVIAGLPEIQTKHINTPCGQNVEFLNVKSDST